MDELFTEEPPERSVKPSLEPFPGIPPCKLANALRTEVVNLKLKLARRCRVMKWKPKAMVSLPNPTATLTSVIGDARTVPDVKSTQRIAGNGESRPLKAEVFE
jgi:hypothetical protein